MKTLEEIRDKHDIEQIFSFDINHNKVAFNIEELSPDKTFHGRFESFYIEGEFVDYISNNPIEINIRHCNRGGGFLNSVYIILGDEK